MLVKDWKREAADEIADDLRMPEMVIWMRSVIDRHCPMQDDVVYMPVPRCATCKHWRQFELEDIGECLEAETCTLMAVRKGVTLETREEFGCVRWEERP